MRLLEYLANAYPSLLEERYKLNPTEFQDYYDLLCEVGKKRGMMMRGGVVDTERAAVYVLDEFRSGKLGRITIEAPEVL